MFVKEIEFHKIKIDTLKNLVNNLRSWTLLTIKYI